VRPRQSYILWFSQRVGSTLLAQTLEDLGIAGRPREWFEGFAATTGDELRETLWREGTTSNGVLGIKYGPWKRHAEITALLGDWQAVFPNCAHVFMTRRDKVRLAVSWWRAIRSGEWHRPAGAEAAVVTAEYDRDAIAHLVREAGERESLIARQLAAWGVTPYTIVYEDMIGAYEPTVRALLDFLAVPGREGVTIPAPALARLADAVSDAWYERYQRDMLAR
jgi:trehalose 2-sulfotransferase